jgi:hypothetical protein
MANQKTPQQINEPKPVQNQQAQNQQAQNQQAL